jgi:hypothetical protein
LAFFTRPLCIPGKLCIHLPSERIFFKMYVHVQFFSLSALSNVGAFADKEKSTFMKTGSRA